MIIDWGAATIGDYRLNLGFSNAATSSTGLDVKKKFTTFYREFTNQDFINIEYFMIISVLHNLIRLYSILINYQITNENEKTVQIFMVDYKEYSKYLVAIVKEISRIKLKTSEKKI